MAANEGVVDDAVARLQAGDFAAIEVLHDHFYDLVFAYAEVALKDAHAAQDIAQLVFERAFRGIDQYAPHADVPFRAWLFRIARNTIIDALRRGHSTPVDPDLIAGLQARHSDTSEGMVLSIRDTGIGIPREERSHLFERFFRASTARERQIPGTGLGLAITKAIVTAHEGSIAVEGSAPGTTFVVTLPAAG